MPLLPSTTFFHAVARSLPTGETIPMPVTTTRRLLMRSHPSLVSRETYAGAGCVTRKRKLRHDGAASVSLGDRREAAPPIDSQRARSGLDVGLDVIDRLLD